MNLYEKINAIMGDVKSLKKDGNIAFGTTKYNFLSEAKTTETFHELFVKYKIVLLPVDIEEIKEGQITRGIFTYRMVNIEDPTDCVILKAAGHGHDSMDKGAAKASSMAYKYLLWRTFAIASNDDPDQTSSAELKSKAKEESEKARLKEIADKNKKITKAKQNRLLDLIIQTDSDPSAMLSKFKVSDVKELTESQFQIAENNYKNKLKTKLEGETHE